MTDDTVTRAAEVFADTWNEGIHSGLADNFDDEVKYTRLCMRAVADAGLLARDLPNRVVVAQAIAPGIWGRPFVGPATQSAREEALRQADAVLTLIRGED